MRINGATGEPPPTTFLLLFAIEMRAEPLDRCCVDR